MILHGLIGHKFWEESDLDLFWTRASLILTRARLVSIRADVLVLVY